MVDMVYENVMEGFNWLFNQLGWADLTWIKVLVIVLAFFGALSLLRRILGSSPGVASSTMVLPPQGGSHGGGFPTEVYTADPSLGDFRIPNRMYDFKPPSPEIDTSELTKPLKVDTDLAKRLFLGSKGTGLGSEFELDWERAKRLFVPPNRQVSESEGETKDG